MDKSDLALVVLIIAVFCIFGYLIFLLFKDVAYIKANCQYNENTTCDRMIHIISDDNCSVNYAKVNIWMQLKGCKI
jgi:hypothetical protein